MIDSLLALEPGKAAVASKRFPASTPFFEDHFPGWPAVPGVLQVEMIAATGGKALKAAHPQRRPLLAAVKKAKFHRRIQPEEECRIEVEITQLSTHRAAAEGRIEVAGELACRATVLYALVDAGELPPDPVIEAWWEGRR